MKAHYAKPIKRRALRTVAITALLFMSGCEFAGFVVSQGWQSRECGSFDEPPGLEEKMSALGNQYKFDEALALLETYEHTRNPTILASIAYMKLGKVEESPDDPISNRRIVELFTLAALCGEGHATFHLASIYRAGVLGVEKNSERGACLEKIFDFHRYERSLIPGRVWACGLRMENIQE